MHTGKTILGATREPRVFSGLPAAAGRRPLLLGGRNAAGGQPGRADQLCILAKPFWGRLARPEFFRVFPLQPAAGRSFSAEEMQPGGSPAVLISYAYWQNHFGGDSRA